MCLRDVSDMLRNLMPMPGCSPSMLMGSKGLLQMTSPSSTFTGPFSVSNCSLIVLPFGSGRLLRRKMPPLDMLAANTSMAVSVSGITILTLLKKSTRLSMRLFFSLFFFGPSPIFAMVCSRLKSVKSSATVSRRKFNSRSTG